MFQWTILIRIILNQGVCFIIFKYKAFLGYKWKAIGAVQHFGDTPKSGHYTAYHRTGNGQWYYFNDDAEPKQKDIPRDLKGYKKFIFLNYFLDISLLFLEKIKSEEKTPIINEINPLDESQLPIKEKLPIEEKMETDENINQNIIDSSLINQVIIKKILINAMQYLMIDSI